MFRITLHPTVHKEAQLQYGSKYPGVYILLGNHSTSHSSTENHLFPQFKDWWYELLVVLILFFVLFQFFSFFILQVLFIFIISDLVKFTIDLFLFILSLFVGFLLILSCSFLFPLTSFFLYPFFICSFFY